MKIVHGFISSVACIVLLLGQAFAAPEFLPPEKAFRVEVAWLENSNQLEIELSPVKGYYIYRESLHFRAGFESGKLDAYKPLLPNGVEKFDQTFQKKLEIYKYPLIVSFDVKQPKTKPIFLEIELQGCAEAGICYPPMTLKFLLAAPGVKAGPIPEPEVPDGVNQTANIQTGELGLLDLWRERDNIGAIGDFLNKTSHAYLFLAFFILGLALAFTPCVLPMLPILSSVIFGTQGGLAISKARASLLALAYILGMAMMYALAGVLMAALGGSVQRVLQSPAVVAGFAILLLALSGSLFGLYDLRLPQAWHHHVDRIAGRQKGGSVPGALALGGISTLVASPCITAPLAGVLAFIAQTGSMTLGAGLLFVMALGMGLPLLLIAIEARILIPSTGIWMIWLQRTLGVLLVATALWIASPLLQGGEVTSKNGTFNSGGVRQIGADLRFTIIHSPAEFESELAKAKSETKLVLLDFYADWCISCKEMEVRTFADPRVAQELKKFVLLQADVTKNSTDNQALLKRFGLFGPPGILIFDLQSQEMKDQRVIGYMAPERFLERIQKLSRN